MTDLSLTRVVLLLIFTATLRDEVSLARAESSPPCPPTATGETLRNPLEAQNEACNPLTLAASRQRLATELFTALTSENAEEARRIIQEMNALLALSLRCQPEATCSALKTPTRSRDLPGGWREEVELHLVDSQTPAQRSCTLGTAERRYTHQASGGIILGARNLGPKGLLNRRGNPQAFLYRITPSNPCDSRLRSERNFVFSASGVQLVDSSETSRRDLGVKFYGKRLTPPELTFQEDGSVRVRTAGGLALTYSPAVRRVSETNFLAPANLDPATCRTRRGKVSVPELTLSPEGASLLSGRETLGDEPDPIEEQKANQRVRALPR